MAWAGTRPMWEAPRDGTQVWLFASGVKPSIWEWADGKWRRGNGLHWGEDEPALAPIAWLPVVSPALIHGDGVAEARGFAIIENGRLNVRTVQQSRAGAMVNWLLVSQRMLASNLSTDAGIEHAFRGTAPAGTACVEVSIRQHAPPMPAGFVPPDAGAEALDAAKNEIRSYGAPRR